jgi:phenylalanyl-tRNA synthetase beta chain
LRKDLTHYLLKVFSENVNNEFPQRIFEIGRVFSLKDNSPHEKNNIALAICPGNFTELKQILNYLFKMMGKSVQFEEPKENPEYFIKGRVAEIKLENKALGFLGEIHPRILRNWKIRMPVALFEMDFDDIMKSIPR